jgi:hypothetical protein
MRESNPGRANGDTPMVRTALVTAALVAAIAIPSAAPSFAKAAPKAKTFYVEQVVKSKACYVVAYKPHGKKVVDLGASSYPTLKAAIAALKANPACKPIKHHHVAMTAKPKTK